MRPLHAPRRPQRPAAAERHCTNTRTRPASRVLVGVDRPESIHTWKRNPRVDQLRRGLGDGTVPLTHDGFGDAPASPAREHTRELLIHHGLLPGRDPDLARFERWLQERLDSIDEPTVRRPPTADRSSSSRPDTTCDASADASAKSYPEPSKQEISEVGRFLTWLAEQDKTIYKTCDRAGTTSPTSRSLAPPDPSLPDRLSLQT